MHNSYVYNYQGSQNNYRNFIGILREKTRLTVMKIRKYIKYRELQCYIQIKKL